MEKSKNILAKPYDDVKTPFTIDERGAIAEYIIQHPDELPLHLAIGASVLIKDFRKSNNSLQTYWVSGRIAGMKAISPFNPERESMLYHDDEEATPFDLLEVLPGGPHNHQPIVLKIVLDHEMEATEGKIKYLISPIQRPPSALSRMSLPRILEDKDNPTLKDILSLRDEGVNLGCVGSGNNPFVDESHNFLEYLWDVNDLENKHMFIVGESGSGKTVFLKNLAYEIRKTNHKNRVIMIDVQGDISQIALPDLKEFVLDPRIAWQKRYSEHKLKNVSTEEIFKIQSPITLIVPKSRDGKLSSNLSALKTLCKADKKVDIKEVGLRLQDLSKPSDVEYLFKVSSPQVAVLLDSYAEWMRNKPDPEPVTIQNLKKYLQEAYNKSKQKEGVKSKTGTIYYPSTFEAAFRALESLSYYFDYDNAALNGDHPFTSLRNEGTIIVYLADLNIEERIMWEMQLVGWLNANNDSINNPDKDGSHGETYVFFDEAHQIIPSKPIGIADKETFERLRSNFEKLAREGRKFGINLILSTQSPKDLHEIVPEQCPNRVVMKINPRNAQHAYLDPELAMIASKFNYGQFWFQSPFNGTPNWIRIHSITNPLPHASVKKYWPIVIKQAKAH